jgi:hypothetical protein
VRTALAAPDLNFSHLLSMTAAHGTFEHALFNEPRPEHGFCTDDMARVLVVATREPEPATAVCDLAFLSLKFLQGSLDAQGKCRNRMNRYGSWEDVPALDDCWGRTIWGLGTAVSHSEDDFIRASSLNQLERAMTQRSGWPRSMAFAALGAAEVLSVEPGNASARSLLADAAEDMPGLGQHTDWPWPEPRLTYANAVLPEAMIAAGSSLDRPDLQRRGLELLAWLLARETQDGYLSVTPVGGSDREDQGPGFDQQPIEAAALADACVRALQVDGGQQWRDGVTAAVHWFLGENDSGVVMWNPLSGGGFDGLQRSGANLNQGAESTLAFLSTMQHARRSVSVL